MGTSRKCSRHGDFLSGRKIYVVGAAVAGIAADDGIAFQLERSVVHYGTSVAGGLATRDGTARHGECGRTADPDAASLVGEAAGEFASALAVLERHICSSAYLEDVTAAASRGGKVAVDGMAVKVYGEGYGVVDVYNVRERDIIDDPDVGVERDRLFQFRFILHLDRISRGGFADVHVDVLAAGAIVEVVTCTVVAITSHSQILGTIEPDVRDGTAVFITVIVLGVAEVNVFASHIVVQVAMVVVEVGPAAAGRKLVCPAFEGEVGETAGLLVCRLDIEIGDGRAAASRAVIRLVKQVDVRSAGPFVQVLVYERPSLILVCGLITVGLILVAADEHHVGDVLCTDARCCQQQGGGQEDQFTEDSHIFFNRYRVKSPLFQGFRQSPSRRCARRLAGCRP